MFAQFLKLFAPKRVELLRKKEIIAWLSHYHIEHYTIRLVEKGQRVDPDDERYIFSKSGYVVDVVGNIKLDTKKMSYLPIQFGLVKGNMSLKRCNLLSLEGSPIKIMGDFIVSQNLLTTLKGAPEYVGAEFYCCQNRLTDLEGAPKITMTNFYCQNNNIKTLKTVQEKQVHGVFNCSSNNLNNLLGAQTTYGNSFICTLNPLVSLMGCPKEIEGDFLCDWTTLDNISVLPQYVQGECSFQAKDEAHRIPALVELYLPESEYVKNSKKIILKKPLKDIQDFLLREKLQIKLEVNQEKPVKRLKI